MRVNDSFGSASARIGAAWRANVKIVNGLCLIKTQSTGATGSASANQKGRLRREALAKPVAPNPSIQD